MSVDVNKPLENPRLKELFRQKAAMEPGADDSDVMNALLEEIVMRAHFLSVIQTDIEPNGEGSVCLEKDTTMAFPMLTLQDDAHVYPVFIDWEELGKWEAVRAAQTKTLILGFEDYAHMVIDQKGGDGIVINPFSDALVLNRAYMIHLLERRQIALTGHMEKVMEKETTVELGQPADYPSAMVKAICKQVKKNPHIHSIWLFLMKKDEEFSYLLVVDFTGDRQEAFRQIGTAAQPYLKDMFLDITPLTGDFSAAVRGVKPFYIRKRGLFG